ncbi:MAG TPA: ATP-binding protein [Polyangiaceae bacterium]|jgi:signal transduction histidine kinase/ActR/RegA family two-component response regulator|nr:ATP-binding protein [Polyangiaceae bacterium]
MDASQGEHERCVLVLMHGTRDAERMRQLLANAGVASRVCKGVWALGVELSRGAGAIVITGEVLSTDANSDVERVLSMQEPWSVVPLLLIVREHAPETPQRAALARYPGLTVLEQPVRARTLVSAIESALRGRANQYQVRELIRERERQSRELATQDEKLRSALRVLSEQADRLRSTDKLKDDFLATLAHELRNPLAPITAGLSVLESDTEPERTRHTLAIMRRQANHMVRLIDDLLDVSRITTGKLELKIERFTLESAVDAAVEATLPSLRRAQQSLSLHLPDETLHLNADQTRVAQVISNLLSNASKYTPAGGHIELSVERQGDGITIVVRDDGLGIPPGRVEEIFKMFAQVDRPLEPSQGGLGIGLALVRRLVEMHGGRVDAHSDGHGKGSTFTVHLPVLTRASGPDRAAAAPVEKPIAVGKRVLIVDDNEDASELLAGILKQDGFDAVVAKDGPSALEAASAIKPHLVILDIGLPGMSGYEVAVKLRQDAELSKLSIIALTGWGSPEDKRRAFEAGFDLHLTKPVFAEELRRAIGSMIPAAAPAP